MIEPKVFSVGQINRYMKNLLENDMILNSLLVQGEISNFKEHSSGHWYFTLKDAQGAISCVIFRQHAEQIPFAVENGMQVILAGYISLYEKTGQYQLYAEFLQPVGVGPLQLAFEQVKAKLAQEGLFDSDFKRELPKQIETIAVITSPTGAAVRDIIQIVKRRDKRVKIAVFPTLVQGEMAAADIVDSIKRANAWKQADVIILGRGGGSAEDLCAFNEECVARAIFASEIPVISAVGHETDFTIADFVSDLRAPTPSAAAELATTELERIEEEVQQKAEQLYRQMQTIFLSCQKRLDFLEQRPVMKRPLERIYKTQIYLEGQERRLLQEMMRKAEQKKAKFSAAEGRLAALSPFSVMQRGYAVAMNLAGKAVTSIVSAEIGDCLQIRLKDGILDTTVMGKRGIDDGKGENDI